MAIVACTALLCAEARADAHTEPVPASDAVVQAATASESPASAAPAASVELEAIRAQIERAEFQAAELRLHSLLARSLDARDHNAALELRAVLALAARREQEAQAALHALYARDPEHVSRVSELGPQVSAAFERAASALPPPVAVAVGVTLARSEDGRPRLALVVEDGARAVEQLHTFVRYRGEPRYTQLVLERNGELGVVVPEPSGLSGTLDAYVEARAPSGAMLARAGDAASPISFDVTALVRAPPCAAPPEAEPLRRRWWLWTSVSIVAAGIITGSAIVAR